MLQKGLEGKGNIAYEFTLGPDFHNPTVILHQTYHLEVTPDN